MSKLPQKCIVGGTEKPSKIHVFVTFITLQVTTNILMCCTVAAAQICIFSEDFEFFLNWQQCRKLRAINANNFAEYSTSSFPWIYRYILYITPEISFHSHNYLIFLLHYFRAFLTFVSLSHDFYHS